MLVRVVAPHFVAGIILEGGVVVKAAPILWWTVGKKSEWLRLYLQRKKWVAHVIKK